MFLFNPEETLVTSAFVGELDLVQKHSEFPHVKPMGIGNLEQAIQTFEYLSTHPNTKQIVFLGSCGVYPWNECKPGTIVSPNSVYTKELIASLGLGKQLPMERESYPLRQDPSFASGVCNAPTTITLHPLENLPDPTWDSFAIENMELFGLAKVATLFQIPVTAYLVVTNTVGPSGSSEWQSKWRAFSNQLQNLFLAHQSYKNT